MSKEAADMREAASTEPESVVMIGRAAFLMMIRVAPTTKTPSKNSQYPAGNAIGQTDQRYFHEIETPSQEHAR